MEHRSQRRRRAFALVEIQSQNQHTITGLVHNISQDGVFILSTVMPKVDRVVEISISTSTENGLPIPVRGRVVHCNRNGFGLMFCKQEDATWQLLDKLSNSFVERAQG